MALVVLMVGSVFAAPAALAADEAVGVIVQEHPSAGNAPEEFVEALGGSVVRQLDIIGGFAAQVPRSDVAALEAHPLVTSVVTDGSVQLQGKKDKDHDAFGDEFQDDIEELEDLMEDLEGDLKKAHKKLDKATEELGEAIEKAEEKDKQKDWDKVAERQEELDEAQRVVDELEEELDDATIDLEKVVEKARKAAFDLLEETLKTVKVGEYWESGFTGSGVDVAVIDSGIAPVPGLDSSGKIVNGPDLSFDSQSEQIRYLDGFGHGTHMAGIIAGNDEPLSLPTMKSVKTEYYGVAPGARLVNVRVADHNGSVDVSQVIAAIDWVVQHRTDNGMNIRVLNLSFGTTGVQDYQLDPLSYAVEVAWRSGIVVVVAAGNDGVNGQIRNPATNPHVIAVGAVNSKGTIETDDDEVSPFSNCGAEGRRTIDLYAPGETLLSLRVPGSVLDQEYPEAVVHERFFKGSGTSQATAVVSGLAALVLDQRPNATPDQVKALLTSNAKDVRGLVPGCDAGGIPNLAATFRAATPDVTQDHPAATGLGLLELARGDHHVVRDGVVLEGEIDIFGETWDPVTWAPASLAESSWTGGVWNGNSWSGNSWSGNSWSGNSWSGNSWSGNSWSGNSWSGNSWSGNSWSGNSWSGNSWSGNSWSGASWSSAVWG